MEIVSGRTGKPHVTRQQFRQIIVVYYRQEKIWNRSWYPTILSRSEAE